MKNKNGPNVPEGERKMQKCSGEFREGEDDSE